MKINKKSIPLIFIVMVFCIPVVFNFWDLSFWKSPKPSAETFDRIEIKNFNFKIRVTAHNEENNIFVPGAYYIFESMPATGDTWHKIMMLRHDDPLPIDENSISFVNSDVGYVFMHRLFAVTTNGGLTWNLWDAEKYSDQGASGIRHQIRKVEIGENGKGEMLLQTNPENQICKRLLTSTFGQSWEDTNLMKKC